MGKCKARWRVERRDDKREEALLHDFGVQLRWLREQRRMTLEEAEARSGVSTSSLSAYERGEGNPTLRTVMLLAESYQVFSGRRTGSRTVHRLLPPVCFSALRPCPECSAGGPHSRS